MPKAKKCADDVFQHRGLIIRPWCFECPYCGREVTRGGHAEGFRKAGLSKHVYACWEVGLFLRGYVITDGGYGPSQHVTTIEHAKKTYHSRFLKAVRANIRRRKKDGVLHLLQPREP